MKIFLFLDSILIQNVKNSYRSSSESLKKSSSMSSLLLVSIEDPNLLFHWSNLTIVSCETVGLTFLSALTKSFGDIGGICKECHKLCPKNLNFSSTYIINSHRFKCRRIKTSYGHHGSFLTYLRNI